MPEDNFKRPTILQGMIVLLFISLIIYFLARAIFVYYIEYTRLERVLVVLFLLSEAFVMFHAFGYFSGVYRLSGKKPSVAKVPELKSFPPVAILIPARHEPKKVLDSTLASCHNLDYPSKTIYLLDDSSEDKYKKEAEEVTKKYNARIFRRTDRHGAKAGVVNDCLKTLSDKYVVVFDADQNPIPDFLSKLIPILENDPKLAFVQTPQFYSNLETNKVSFGSNIQQAIFYEYVCEGKSSGQAMMCCGTNVVLRREALVDVGGLDESTVTEDFATSLKMHVKGWKSFYYNHVNTFGMGPEDLGAYFKQQNRWALGNVGVFKMVVHHFLRGPSALKLSQWFEYFITGSYYLIGWAYLFLVLCPIIYIFSGIPKFFMDPVVYTLTFVPYFVLSLAVFYTSMLKRFYNIPQLFKGQVLAFITLPVYMRASLFALIGIKGSFQVTSKEGTRSISYLKLWPQIAFWAICLAAITWGLNRFVYERTGAIAVNIMWTTYHLALLSGIFYYNEEETLTETCKMLKKGLIFEYRVIEGPRGFEHLAKDTWKSRFKAFLTERLDAGTVIMCKIIKRNKEAIIFDGSVLASSEKKKRKGFETIIGVVTISEKDRERLREVMKI